MRIYRVSFFRGEPLRLLTDLSDAELDSVVREPHHFKPASDIAPSRENLVEQARIVQMSRSFA